MKSWGGRSRQMSKPQESYRKPLETCGNPQKPREPVEHRRDRLLKFAGPLAHGVLDLVCDAWDAGLASLGVCRIPPRAKRAPPWGDPRPQDLRRRRVEVPSKSCRSPVEAVPRHGIIKQKKNPKIARNSNGFWIPKCFQKPPKIKPKYT